MVQSDQPIFIFYQDTLLMVSNTLPRMQDIDPTVFMLNQFLISDGALLIAGSHIEASKLKGLDWIPLRKALTLLSEEEQHLVFKAKSLLRWEALHQYCGQCGEKTQPKTNEMAKYCPNCDELFYPRFSPSVIVVIHDHQRILLGRKSTFMPGMYSCLAGFIEPGESAEMAIHREMLEEVNATVSDIRYFGSQAWPFPDSFMLGFFAKYQSGDLIIEKAELEDAKWFDIDALPTLPTTASISHHLIQHYVNNWQAFSNLD